MLRIKGTYVELHGAHMTVFSGGRLALISSRSGRIGLSVGLSCEQLVVALS